jgi:hypothetical protein
MSSASAISAFFAGKKGTDSDLKDRFPGSYAATGGVGFVDTTSVDYSSSVSGRAQVPVGTDEDQGVDGEADKREVCELKKLSPHAAAAIFASSTSTKQGSFPGGDQNDSVIAAIGASAASTPSVDCCDLVPAIMCVDKEKEKGLSESSNVWEVCKDGGDEGDFEVPSAASATSGFFAAKKSEEFDGEDQKSDLAISGVGVDVTASLANCCDTATEVVPSGKEDGLSKLSTDDMPTTDTESLR